MRYYSILYYSILYYIGPTDLCILQLVPHHIHVVSESRLYRGWSSLSTSGPAGLVEARRELARLHRTLAEDGFSEVFVDQLNIDCVAVSRHCPRTRR